MRKIKWTMGTGYPGADHTGEVEVEDDATDAEIEEAVCADAYQYLDLWWEES